ncbi:MAG: TetR/AcrR family transcriptional regulator [Rhodospirillales bacterium]|nr:TetR/AcrR family transcriptional regulator [Rhodospirillales bacterium]MCB9996880.1 TetR/AcrR family transcriptional regulator [Rhodospirillales bacterium]
MARRSDHTREELEKLILDAAWAIIGTDGYNGLTARGIAKHIGYTPGTIYNLFASMDDLSLHINARTLDLLYDVLADPACNDPKKSPAQNMKRMARHYIRFAQEYRPYWLMLFSYSLPEGRRDDPWYQQKIDRLFSPLETLLCPYFSPRQDGQRQKTARLLWASVHGLCFLQETGKIALAYGKKNGGKAAADSMADMLIDTFLNGIKSR